MRVSTGLPLIYLSRYWTILIAALIWAYWLQFGLMMNRGTILRCRMNSILGTVQGPNTNISHQIYIIFFFSRHLYFFQNFACGDFQLFWFPHVDQICLKVRIPWRLCFSSFSCGTMKLSSFLCQVKVSSKAV